MARNGVTILQVVLGTENQESRTEPKESGTETERIGTEKVVPNFLG